MIVDMAKRGPLIIFFSIGKPGIAVLMNLAAFLGLQLLNTWVALFSGLITLFGGSILFGGLSSEEKDSSQACSEKRHHE